MAKFIPAGERPSKPIETPLTLTALQNHVGGFIRFVELETGDLLVVNEAATEVPVINKAASAIANQQVYGDVVLCDPSEIA